MKIQKNGKEFKSNSCNSEVLNLSCSWVVSIWVGLDQNKFVLRLYVLTDWKTDRLKGLCERQTVEDLIDFENACPAFLPSECQSNFFIQTRIPTYNPDLLITYLLSPSWPSPRGKVSCYVVSRTESMLPCEFTRLKLSKIPLWESAELRKRSKIMLKKSWIWPWTWEIVCLSSKVRKKSKGYIQWDTDISLDNCIILVY